MCSPILKEEDLFWELKYNLSNVNGFSGYKSKHNFMVVICFCFVSLVVIMSFLCCAAIIVLELAHYKVLIVVGGPGLAYFQFQGCISCLCNLLQNMPNVTFLEVGTLEMNLFDIQHNSKTVNGS